MRALVKILHVSILVGFLCLSEYLYSYAFEVGSHAELSDLAVRSSLLDNVLKGQLNFPAGIEEKLLNGKNVIDLVVEGSRREDDENRFCNHFHNPLSTWSTAGLQIPIPIICPATNHSSVLWGQGLDLQPSGKQFAWQNARTNYFEGLTAQTQSEREEKLGLTFRALGQLSHLVQDAAVPAHSRNDPHPLERVLYEGLESFVENTRLNNKTLFTQLTGSSQTFDPSILAATPNDSAPIPIAHIIDLTDSDQAAAVPSAGIDQGMAEYSNSNFLSNDTIFINRFTFPREESLGSFFLGIEPLTLLPRIYFPKISDGETFDHFVATSSLFEALIPFGQANLGYVLDRRVFQDYAAKLLPRAIGYSAGLIDYFFRGRMELTVQRPDQASGSPATSLRVSVRNSTPGEETGSGEMIAVVTFTTGGQQSLAASLAQPVNLTRDFQEINFDFSQTPIPPDASNLFLVVVYKGPLGLEEGAVVAKITCRFHLDTPPGTFATIDVPGAIDTQAFGINKCGQIVGISTDGTFTRRGFLLSDNTFTTITVPGASTTLAHGINDAGQIVGTFQNPDLGIHGFLFSEGQFTTIDVPSAVTTDAFGINDSGQIVGRFVAEAKSHGFLLSGGQFTTIDVPGATSTVPQEINNSGQIVGQFRGDVGGGHGFLFNAAPIQ